MSFIGGQIAWRLQAALLDCFEVEPTEAVPSPARWSGQLYVKIPCLIPQMLMTQQVVIVLIFDLPESPRYCYAKGRKDEALRILCDVYDRTPDHPKIVLELNEILETLAMEREHGEYRWWNILVRDNVQTGKRVLLAYGMQFMNQVGGINLVCTRPGFSTEDSNACAGRILCAYSIADQYRSYAKSVLDSGRMYT